MAEREAVTEVLTYWERKGLEQGLEQGRAGFRQAITLQVKQRFGESVETQRMKPLSLEALQGLALAVLEVDTYQEWLDRLEKALDGTADS